MQTAAVMFLRFGDVFFLSEPRESASREGLLVLVHIVEDDPAVGDSLALLLAQIGHESRVYPDAESFFECHPPGADDTVIVDLGLPGLSGMQVVRWLASLKVPPKVIAITGTAAKRHCRGGRGAFAGCFAAQAAHRGIPRLSSVTDIREGPPAPQSGRSGRHGR